MRQLVWKDFYINRAQLITQVAIMAFLTMLSLVWKQSGAVNFLVPLMFTYSSMLVPFLALNSATQEEKNRTLAFLRSLPMDADTIVASKFVTPLLAGLAWAGVSALVAHVVAPVTGESVVSLEAPLLLVCATLPIAALELVMFFKFNANAARTAMMITLFSAYLVPVAVPGLGKKLIPILSMAVSPGPAMIALVVAAALFVYFAGMVIAQAIFRRREV